MTAFPGSPSKRVSVVTPRLRGAAGYRPPVQPDSLTRTLRVQAPVRRGRPFGRRCVLRAPVETIKLDAEIDAAIQLEFRRRTRPQPRTESIPSWPPWRPSFTHEQPAPGEQPPGRSARWKSPHAGPLTLFVWSKNRILPVRLTISHHRGSLRPPPEPHPRQGQPGYARADVDDLGFSQKGGSLYLIYSSKKSA